MATKVRKSKKQRPINAVPLTDDQQTDVDKFLQGINTDNALALVIILRTDGDGTVDANVLSMGLTDKLQDQMAKAALKAVSGKPLFYTIG